MTTIQKITPSSYVTLVSYQARLVAKFLGVRLSEARTLLDACGGLQGLKDAKDLPAVQDLPDSKRQKLSLLTELLESHLAQLAGDVLTISCAEDAYKFLKYTIGTATVESMWAIYLNDQNVVIGVEEVSQVGTRSTAMVSPGSRLFRSAVLHGASAVIFAHNHPSRNLTPSTEDIVMTRKMHTMGKALDIRVLDHLIITSNGHRSVLDDEVHQL